jgi:hypothetical protein
MYADPVREYKISPDRSTGSPEKGATGFKSDVTHHSLASFLKDLLPLPAQAAQGNSNFEKNPKGDNTAASDKIDYLAKDLSKTQRQMLHREISKKGYTDEQIMEAIQRIKDAYPGK